MSTPLIRIYTEWDIHYGKQGIRCQIEADKGMKYAIGSGQYPWRSGPDWRRDDAFPRSSGCAGRLRRHPEASDGAADTSAWDARYLSPTFHSSHAGIMRSAAARWMRAMCFATTAKNEPRYYGTRWR